jgi:hypothetical protein
MGDEVNIIISQNKAFFYTHPPRKLLELLREKYGLQFKEKVIYCG